MPLARITNYLTSRRLDQVLAATRADPQRVIPFTDGDKFIIFSDCHRGDNSWKDDYAPNRHLHLHALDYYFDNGFTYFELGDGDELWEVSRFGRIAFAHRDTFYRMRSFFRAGRDHGDEPAGTGSGRQRLYMLFGNHDIQRRDPRVVRDQLHEFYIEYKRRNEPMLPGIQVYEGLLLCYQYEDEESASRQKEILLVHGHQGDWLNDYLWWLAMAFVRYIWAPLQQFIGWRDPTLPPHPLREEEDRILPQRRITEWIKKTRRMVVAGHTHRAYMPAPEQWPYINCGSCVHPRCITGIEIVGGEVRLVKWELMTRSSDGVLQIVREVLVTTPILDFELAE